MVGILETLRSRMTARRENNSESLVAAARRIAAGESVDAGSVEAALVAESKSVDDFEALCELARRRLTWHAARDKGPAAIVQRDKLNAELDAARELFERTRLAWVEKSGRLASQLSAVVSIVQASDDATERLTNPANVPGVLAERIRTADAEHVEALEAVEAIQRELREARSRVKTETEWVTHKKEFNNNTHLSTLDDHKRALARAERRAAELEAALPPAEAAVAAALKTLGERRAAALKI
jgi:hypothetical protein